MDDTVTDQFRWTARLAEAACEWTIAAHCWDKAVDAFRDREGTDFRRLYARTMARRARACRVAAEFFEVLTPMTPSKPDPQP